MRSQIIPKRHREARVWLNAFAGFGRKKNERS